MTRLSLVFLVVAIAPFASCSESAEQKLDPTGWCPEGSVRVDEYEQVCTPCKATGYSIVDGRCKRTGNVTTAGLKFLCPEKHALEYDPSDVDGPGECVEKVTEGGGAPKGAAGSAEGTSSCNTGDECLELANLYASGKDRPKDVVRAFEFLETACSRGNASACNTISIAHRNARYPTTTGFLPRDRQRAAEYAQKALSIAEGACEEGDGRACKRLAYTYKSGSDDVKVDASRASRLFKKAARLLRSGCEENQARQCAELGWLHQVGYGVPADVSHAIRLYEKACGAGASLGCSNLSTLYQSGKSGVKRDYSRANLYLDRACSLGDGDSCRLLGTIHLSGLNGVDKDSSKALALFEKACAAGNAKGCEQKEQIRGRHSPSEHGVVGDEESEKLRAEALSKLDAASKAAGGRPNLNQDSYAAFDCLKKCLDGCRYLTGNEYMCGDAARPCWDSCKQTFSPSAYQTASESFARSFKTY